MTPQQAAARQASAFVLRKNSRSRRFGLALPVHAAGLVVTGVDVTGSTSTADYVQDDEGQGLPFVALTSGTTGATPLDPNANVSSDGAVTWQRVFQLLSPPPVPA